MKRLLEWVREQRRKRGRIVGMVAALALLMLLTMLLAAVMGIVGLLIWLNPYAGVIAAAAATAFLIYKRY